MDYLRDTREKSFLINDEYLNGYAKLCGINATGVYISLCRHADKKQTCFPSKKLIAEELAISERSVYSALKSLVKWNIVKIEEQGRKKDGSFRNKIYTLINKHYWKEKTPQANCAVGKKRHSPQANDDTTRRQQVPNKETHIKETHIKEVLPKSKTLSYQEIKKQKYKSKAKVFQQKGLPYTPREKTTKQEKTLEAFKIIDYFKEQAYEQHGFQFFKVQDDARNKKMRSLIIRAYEELGIEDSKKLIDWWLEGEGEWASYEPEQCFTSRTMEGFGNSEKQKPIKTIGHLKFYSKEEIDRAWKVDKIIEPDDKMQLVLTPKGRKYEQ